jgi:aminoglycoside phosphotransferase (APT) family kinase protein
MEEGWERPPHVVPEPDVLAGLVRRAFPHAEVERSELLTTGLANTNLRLWLHGHARSYVLRVYTRDPRAVERERALMSYLPPGFPVPELVHAASSPVPFSLWSWVEGELLQVLFKSASPRELVSIAEACGRTLAALAPLRFERCGELDERLIVAREYGPPSIFVPDVIRAKLAGLPGQRLGRPLSDSLEAAVKRSQPLLGELDGDYRLVHGDFKRSNLLVSREGEDFRVAAVLDWEFAFAGPPLVDFGLFLRAGGRLPPGFADAFARGYQAAGGTLPARWRQLSRLVDLLSQLTFLDGTVERPRVWAESKDVVQETIEILSAH